MRIFVLPGILTVYHQVGSPFAVDYAGFPHCSKLCQMRSRHLPDPFRAAYSNPRLNVMLRSSDWLSPLEMFFSDVTRYLHQQICCQRFAA